MVLLVINNFQYFLSKTYAEDVYFKESIDNDYNAFKLVPLISKITCDCQQNRNIENIGYI